MCTWKYLLIPHLSNSAVAASDRVRLVITVLLVCVCVCRILTIVCSDKSPIFACSAASSTGTPPNASYLNRSFGLTSPSLPSSRYTSGELNQLHASSQLTSSQQPHEVYPGAVYIYDIKTRQKKVHSLSLSLVCMFTALHHVVMVCQMAQ